MGLKNPILKVDSSYSIKIATIYTKQHVPFNSLSLPSIVRAIKFWHRCQGQCQYFIIVTQFAFMCPCTLMSLSCVQLKGVMIIVESRNCCCDDDLFNMRPKLRIVFLSISLVPQYASLIHNNAFSIVRDIWCIMMHFTLIVLFPLPFFTVMEKQPFNVDYISCSNSHFLYSLPVLS